MAARASLGDPRRCAWCPGDVSPGSRATFCCKRCRQSAWRLRRRRGVVVGSGTPAGARFAYADPPYPGKAHYYRGHADYAGEVNHVELIASLGAGGLAGWALSTSAEALRDVLPLCPPGARVAAWVKPIGVSRHTYGIHNTWEPVIVVGGRALRGGVRDWLRAQPARRGGSDLLGRKPLAFCAWLFDLLGMVPGDELLDLYPGSGVVARAWAEVCRSSTSDAAAVGDAATFTPPTTNGSARGGASR